jgi:hypothetical protein
MMGIFGDVSRLMKQAKEIDKTFDPGAQAQAGIERMRTLNASMGAQTDAMTDGTPGTAQINTVMPAFGAVNMNPVMQVTMLVTPEGGMPRPVEVPQMVVTPMQMYKLVPGATLPVKISASNPDNVAIDWAGLGVA